ncbi:hypothetical protein [Streptomyces sp. CAU 1734]|uniref:hypothetical protein n=1 Tax=Streptomyces sp. CAU 1734 TaxID=3140360 RepID=UPI0032603098
MESETVRRVVREEIRKALNVLVSEAHSFPNYETDTLEDTAARVLERLTESALDTLKHPEDCPVRRDRSWYGSCTCGVYV